MEPENNAQMKNSSADATLKANPAKETSSDPEKSDTIIIRMWPKTPVLYPMATLALLFGLIGLFAGSTPHIRALNKMYNPTEQTQTIQSETSSTTTNEATPDTTSTTEPSAVVSPETTPIVVDEAQVAVQAQKLASGLFLDRVMGTIFLLVFAFSLFTLSVDLEVRWAMLTFASAMVVLLLLILINQHYEFLPGVLSTIASLSPMANPQFYFAIFAIWVVLMVISRWIVHFHYVRIESNEIIVVGGLLERQQRYPTMRMRYTRDIQDVFEYYMPFVRSGRLILSFAEQNEAVVIDNVLNIDKVTKHLDQISGVLHVRGNDSK